MDALAVCFLVAGLSRWLPAVVAAVAVGPAVVVVVVVAGMWVVFVAPD
jgi:hypothetical protein